MSFQPSDLGEIHDLATAIGLIGESGFQPDWLTKPGDYLSSVLANEKQRQALIAFIDEALGGSERRTDSAGRIWVPLIEGNNPKVSFFLVLDESPSTHIRIGLGISISTTAPISTTSLHVPLFKAAKGNNSVGDVVLLGTAAGVISFAVEITVDPVAPAPGAAHLGRVGLGLEVPTGGGAAPTFSLTLGALQLPGATAPRDLELSLDSLDTLDDTALDLVLGLIQAQAAGLPPGPLTALAGLLGLGGGAIPPLPIADFASVGPQALALWFDDVVGDTAVRNAWLGQLASLIGNGAAAAADGVSFNIGPADVTLAIRSQTGTAGAAIITPALTANIVSGSIRAVAEIELARIDLGSGSATALPRLSLVAHAGRGDGAGSRILTGDPQVDAVRIGLALDGARKPIPILAAEGVTIGTNHYDTLDLSTPDAVVEALGTVLSDVVDDLIGQLGPVGGALSVLFGLAPPPSAPAVPTIDLGTFLSNPLAAVGSHWRTLLQAHADAVPSILELLRSLIADAAAAIPPITGTGTAADPWRMPLVGPAALQFYSENGGDTLHIGLSAGYSVDTLGQRCTVIESRLTVGLAKIDLAQGGLVLAAAIEARLTARARGDTRARFSAGPIALSAYHIGLSAAWSPDSGVSITALAPNPSAEFNAQAIPIALPSFNADGTPNLDAAGWDLVQRFLGLLGAQSPLPAFRDLVEAFGWIADSPNLADDPALSSRPHLRLADFVADPTATLKAWAQALLLEESGPLLSALRVLARQLTGTVEDLGAIRGFGRPDAPYRLPLLGDGAGPELLYWLEPHGPNRPTMTNVPEALRDWRPGFPGLGAPLLAEALFRESTLANALATLVAGRDDLAAGLAALTQRWLNTDGRIIPPASDLAGVTVHRMIDVGVDELAAAIDVNALLGVAPAVRINIAVVAAGGPLPWTAVAADRLIDLRAPGLSPESFALPAAAPGEWFIALAGRAAAILPSGDVDGIGGQAARLQRVLAAFNGLGNVALIADAASGHAARIAAEALPAISALITLGTPAGPVSFTVLDTAPMAEALRVLVALLPAVDPAEPDDVDLARGRSLIKALTELLSLGDPGVELRPPAILPGAPRAGLAVHAIYGVMSVNAVEAAITAVVAAGLSIRAGLRAETIITDGITGGGVGVLLPVSIAADGFVITGQAMLEALGFDLPEGGPPAIRAANVLRIQLSFARESGWLIGGPDPARGPGPRPEHELRRVEATVVIPLRGTMAASAEVVLIEPKVFGIGRDRWVVSAAGVASTTAEIVTPALPEVRVLLAQFAAQLSAAVSPAMVALRDLLGSLGLLDGSGGWVADGIDHLLNEPQARISQTLSDAALRAKLQSGINTLLGAMPGLSLDLATRTLGLTLNGTPGTFGMKPWSLSLSLAPNAAPQIDFTLEASGDSPEGGLAVHLHAAPFALTLERHHPGSPAAEAIPLWPDPDGERILAAVTRLAPAELARLGLDYLRRLDESVRPIIDAAYDALGLLGVPDADGARSVRLPLALIENPIGWLSHAGALGSGSGFSPAKIIALLDAFKPILGISGGPGEWNLASGFVLRAESISGVARLGLQIDSSGFAPVPAADGRLTMSGAVSLSLPAGLPPRPVVDLAVGISGAAPGRRAVHLVSDSGLQIFVRPDSGPDLPLYPSPPGLANLAQAAVAQALPMILDALAAQNGATLAGNVGAAVRALGDALALRIGGPAHFDGPALQAFAVDPAGVFATRAQALSSPLLTALASALGPLLPAPATASFAAGKLAVTVNGVTIRLQPSPFEVTVDADLAGLPVVQTLDLAITLNGSGLKALELDVGPADIDAGGISLRPTLLVAAGNAPAGGRRIQLGLALDDSGDNAVAARWLLDPTSFSLVAVDGTSIETDPTQVALAMIDVVVQLIASFAIATPAVGQLLDKTLPGSGGKKVRETLRGVFLKDVPNPSALDDDLFDPDQLLHRLKKLLANVATAGPKIDIGSGLGIGMQETGSIAELTLELAGRIDLNPGSDVVISLEADSRWIQGTPTAGLALGFLNTTGQMDFAPSLAVNGIGVRVSRSSGPLLDVGVTLGSVAVHLFGLVSGSELSGGAQLQLSDLAASVTNASGGNAIAQGMVADAGKGKEKLAPAFSPALAIQKHGNGPILVSMRAGEGDGPWWLAIQKGFGPIYMEQVGFDTTVTQDQLVDISILLDARVSIAGLTASVDDLRLTFLVASNASVFEPSRWNVDLAGLAVEADMGGVYLAGGLRKFGSGENVEYIGMLLARFAVYGLSIYGGYGTKVEGTERFTAFFAFGAINGPIGGPPAFFLTGIGGGLGINRDLIFPSELDRFGEFIFIRALDPSAKPSGDPMAELVALRDTFPTKRGDFWFAAGISFNSFALVDGIAVISVKVGDGFELALLGLARMALPRPEIALVSIELGLIARFSTKEGVIWVQAQLTENSWLLHESVRLTGGFAFVSWFDGPRAGEFVLTMGGFHPSFHRDGYPVVPRLGFSWHFGPASIKGENYFALTSEALMAGGKLEASAEFGPAWAHVVFGADGIVYFDPFRLEVMVYARISAGITIDVWIGEITISISIGAQIKVEGPKFRGTATFEVGPVDLTVSFGDTQKAPKIYIAWNAFVPKYLEDVGGGVGRCLTALPGKGAIPPGTGDSGSSESGTADGSPEKPFEVLSEFELSITSTVPSNKLSVAGAAVGQITSAALGLAPVGAGGIDSVLEIHLRDTVNVDQLVRLKTENKLHQDVQRGGFPAGVWGNPQPDDDRKVPKGDVIDAVTGVHFTFSASIEGTLPKEMAYFQVRSKERKPLPFLHARRWRPTLIAAAKDTASVVPVIAGIDAMYAEAKPWLAVGGYGATALAVLASERAAPPRLGSLTEGLAEAEARKPRITLPKDYVKPPFDTQVRPAQAIAILRGEIVREVHAPRTTVSEAVDAEVMLAPRLTDIEASMDWAIPAKLVRLPASAAATDRTLIAAGAVPLTRSGQAGVSAIAGRGAAAAGRARLSGLTATLATRSARPARAAAAPRGAAAAISAGEIAVLRLPNADRDSDASAPRPRLVATGGPARVVAFAAGGGIISDSVAGRAGIVIAQGTERLVVAALGQSETGQPAAGYYGWHDAQSLAYAGWATALIPGGTLRAEGAAIRRARQRFRAGWIAAADLIADAALLVTRFTVPVTSIALIIDDPNGSAAAQNLSLGLGGADRVTDKAGKTQPPIVLVIGSRSILIYAVKPRAGKDDTAIQVSVAREEPWRIAGILAGTDDPDSFADRLLDGGLERAVRPLADGRQGSVTLSWVPGRRGGGTVPPTGKPPVVRPPVVKPPVVKPPVVKPPVIRRPVVKPPGRPPVGVGPTRPTRAKAKTKAQKPKAARKKKAAKKKVAKRTSAKKRSSKARRRT
ncbi:MAG TPA: DUF6603 domain-containing protein [Dongiaceae bacterium]|jgi:hypothetical protein|nr:DUF6603 domain-containing protein [Dongiaceae bacterium]